MGIKHDNADRYTGYMFVAGVCVILVGFAFFAVTGQPQPGVRIITTAFWLLFAALNFGNFYTGRINLKNGPTYSRESSPGMFYFCASLFAILSMSFTTFMLWKAYFGD